MSTFFYKYVIAQSFTKGRKTALYFSRFIFRLYRSLPILLRLAIISFRFFTILYNSCHSLINFRFWLLAVYQFLHMYQAIFLLRLITDYCFVNQQSSNKFTKVIFYLSEPYFKIVQLFVHKGIIANMVGLSAMEFILMFMRMVCKTFNTYSSNSVELNELNLLLKLVSDERILLIN